MSNNNTNKEKAKVEVVTIAAKKERKFWKNVAISAVIVATIPIVSLILIGGCGDIEK